MLFEGVVLHLLRGLLDRRPQPSSPSPGDFTISRFRLFRSRRSASPDENCRDAEARGTLTYELHVRGRWVVSLFSSSISSPPGAFRSHCRHCSLLHVRDWNEAIACWRGIRHGEDTEDAARRATLEEVLNSGVFAAAELVYQTQEQRHCSALLWVTLTDAGHLCSKQIDTPFVVRRNSV